MDAAAWLSGLGLGVALAAPVGPVNLLCMRRTALDGWRAGFATGAGAAAADVLLGTLVLGGVSAVSAALLAHAPALRSVGGVGLVLFGIALGILPGSGPRSGPAAAPRRARALASAFASSFALTIANPLPLVGLATALALTGGEAAPGSTLSRVAGLACGSLAWWLALTSAVALVRARTGSIGPDGLRLVNRAVGGVLVVAGMGALVQR